MIISNYRIMMKRKTDWLKVKEEFLVDKYATLKDIAVKYGLSYSLLKKISAEREWFEDKKQVQEILMQAEAKEIRLLAGKNIKRGLRKIKASFGYNFWERTAGRTRLCKTLFGTTNLQKMKNEPKRQIYA